MESDDNNIKECLVEIEKRLNWGPGEAWTTNDFKALSEKIHAATGTNLSVATLKRLWGTIDYQSKPTATTLNALAQYLGHENWKAYQYTNSLPKEHNQKEPTSAETKKGRPVGIILSLLVILPLGAWLLFYISNKDEEEVKPLPDASLFSFSSKQAVSEGVPNSVIFNYDASPASATDTVFIQQSWDERLRQQVPYDKKVHTSIYYYPGYFQAKLVVNDSIVKQHPVYITSMGWLPLVEQETVPVYFKVEDVIKGNGALWLPLEKLTSNNIHLQPETPWTSYFYVKAFEGLQSDNLVFEAELRNDFREGAGICQHTEVHLLLAGGALIVPLAIKGCISGLALYDVDGKVEDPTPLGVDFSDWVKVRYEVKDMAGRLFINDELAYDSLNLHFGPVEVVGLKFRFQGTGSVNYVKLWGKDEELLFEENF
ncbi:MAG: hypothetical protein ACMVP2_26195 [Imperialibacter sp.]|uniref:hypothetical protein n=1 Tax=Imperialibacter sp. TaxID=2038411 RepID=UPI003A84A0BD